MKTKTTETITQAVADEFIAKGKAIVTKARKAAKGKAKAKAKAKKAPKAKAKGKAAAPKAAPQAAKPSTGPAPARAGSKLETIIAMMRRPSGATMADMAKATEWQVASVRGVIRNAVKGRLGLAVELTPDEAGTVFKIVK